MSKKHPLTLKHEAVRRKVEEGSSWKEGEQSQTIIEHMVCAEMINAILLSHLLFINSLSAIMAWAQMKAEGRGKVQVGHH